MPQAMDSSGKTNNCVQSVVSKCCLCLSPSKCKNYGKSQSTFSKCKSVKSLKVLSLSLKVQNYGKSESTFSKVQKCEKPQSAVFLSQSAKLWKPQSYLSLSKCKSVNKNDKFMNKSGKYLGSS